VVGALALLAAVGPLRPYPATSATVEAAHRLMESSGDPVELIDGEHPRYGEHLSQSVPVRDRPRIDDRVPIAWGARHRRELSLPSRLSS
jgi:hypothetical protein